jgi:hypothetical protein
MIALSNKEILDELKTIGINTNIDLLVYFVRYKVYLVCNTWKRNNRKRLVAAIANFFIFFR